MLDKQPDAESSVKVLYLVPPSPSKEGISKYSFISEEIEALTRSGVTAYIVSPHEGHDYTGPGYRKFAVPGLSVAQAISTIRFMLVNLRLTLPLAIRNFRACANCARLEMRAAEIARSEEIDLIHSHFGWPNGVGGNFVRNHAQKPLITSIRGMDILVNDAIDYGNLRDPFFRAALRSLLRNADAVTCNSDYIRREALVLGAPPQKAVTVLKGVDLTRFTVGTDPAAAKRRLTLEDKFTVLSVGGLIPRKGMSHIVQAIARVERDVQCVICGSGPESETLRSLTKQLGIEHKVIFRGQIPRDEIPTYFEAADVFVLASINEAAGNVLIEAAATGTPVISTSSGGPPEYVGHESYGFIVAPGDVTDLAARIRELFDDPQKRAAFGKQARDAAVRQFSYDRMIRKIISIYDSTVKSQPCSSEVSAK